MPNETPAAANTALIMLYEIGEYSPNSSTRIAARKAHKALSELIEALRPVENIDTLRADGTIKDDELVVMRGSSINAIRAALRRVKGEAV